MPRMTPYPRSHTEAGYKAEALAKAHFEESGYTVTPGEKGCDLLCLSPDGELLRLEVKGARQAIDYKWHFTLRKRGHTDISKSDAVMLVQFHSTGFYALYLAPTAFFGDARQVCISSAAIAYKGKMRPYRLD